MVTRHMTVTVVPNSQMSTVVSWYACQQNITFTVTGCHPDTAVSRGSVPCQLDCNPDVNVDTVPYSLAGTQNIAT